MTFNSTKLTGLSLINNVSGFFALFVLKLIFWFCVQTDEYEKLRELSLATTVKMNTSLMVLQVRSKKQKKDFIVTDKFFDKREMVSQITLFKISAYKTVRLWK